MRIYKRKNSPNYYLQLERNKGVSLKTSDYKEAQEIAEKKYGHLKRVCPYCSESFFKTRRFCSNKCRKYYHNEISYYGRLKKEIYEKFNHQCCFCGWEKGLHIHHIDGKGSLVPKKDRNNSKNNLVLLCPQCHLRIHHCKEDPEAQFWGKQEVQLINLARKQLKSDRKTSDH
jgi:hypothetical protein